MGIVWELCVCVCVCEHNRQFDAIVCRGVKVFGMASFLAQTLLHKHSLTPVCVDSTQSLQLRICECSHDIAVMT